MTTYDPRERSIESAAAEIADLAEQWPEMWAGEARAATLAMLGDRADAIMAEPLPDWPGPDDVIRIVR